MAAISLALLMSASACGSSGDGSSDNGQDAIGGTENVTPDNPEIPDGSDGADDTVNGEDGNTPDKDDTVNGEDGNTPDKDDDIITLVAPVDGADIVLANEGVWEFYTEYTKTSSENYKNKGDQYAGKDVVLSWETQGQVSGEYTLSVSANEDMTYPVVVTTKDPSYTLSTLFAAQTYYWQVEGTVDGERVQSDVSTFTTAASPRTITLNGVSNTRDFGGMMTESGVRVAQGLVYRGAYLDEIYPEGIEKALSTYGIKTDLDLRRAGEGTAGTGSPFGDGVNYVHVSAPYYTDIDATEAHGIEKEDNWAALVKELKVFAEPTNYPIYFHCSVGRDRTGTLAFLVNALLGVQYTDLFRDYELSFFSEIGCIDATTTGPTYMVSRLQRMYEYLMTVSRTGNEITLAEHTESFMLNIGMTQDELDTIKSILLGTYDDGNLVKPYLGLAFDDGSQSFDMVKIPESKTTYPTLEELANGYTYDWENTYTSVSNGEVVAVADIEDETVRNALLANPTKFGANVMHLISSGEHTIQAISAKVNADYFKVGYKYEIEFDYYAPTVGTNYFIAFDNTSGNATVASSFMTAGEVNTASLSFVVNENSPYAFTLYTGNDDIDVYIGNLTFTYTPIRADYHTLTKTEIAAGYTYDWGDNNLLAFDIAKYVNVSELEDESLKSALSVASFGEGYAMGLIYDSATSLTVMNFLTPYIASGKTFTVSFDAHVVSGQGNLRILQLVNGKQHNSSAKFTVTQNVDGTYHYTASFSIYDDTVEELGWYGTGNYELYLANFTVQAV